MLQGWFNQICNNQATVSFPDFGSDRISEFYDWNIRSYSGLNSLSAGPRMTAAISMILR